MSGADEWPTGTCTGCGEPTMYGDRHVQCTPGYMPPRPVSERQLDGTKRPAALLHVETDVDVMLDALARWHREQPTDAHPGGFDLCSASPCRDVREAL